MPALSLLGANGPQIYLDLIHRYQPKPVTLVSAPAEEPPFTDDTIHRVCAALDVAAAPFKLAGVVFPPLKAVGEAIGIVNKIILQFSNQDMLGEFVKRINAKITALSAEMDNGFNHLEEVITDVNFLAKVVSPTRELFSAFTRYAASLCEADKDEFLDCYKRKPHGGLNIITTMHMKLTEKDNMNLLWNITTNGKYSQAAFEKGIKYIGNVMYQLYTAHTFYLMQEVKDPERDVEIQEFMTKFDAINARLEELKVWKESAYWDEGFLKPIIEKKTKGQYTGAAAKTISDWLTETYTWDSFVVVIWNNDYTKDDDSYYKYLESEQKNTKKFEIFTDRSAWNDLGTFNVIIHRFRAKNLRDPIDYGKREAVFNDIVDKLQNDRSSEFNLLDAASIQKRLGFGLWFHFCGNNISLMGRKIWSVDYACSPSAKDEFFHLKTRTGDSGPFNRMRANVLIATY